MIAHALSGEWHGIHRTWWLLAVMVALLLLFSGLNALTNRTYVFTDGLVHGVFGRMGSGKSLFIVLRVLLPFCRGLSKGGGVIYSKTGRPVRRVICNFRFDPRMPNVEVRHIHPSEDRTIWRCIRELADEIGATEGPWYDGDGVLHDGREPMPELDPVRVDEWRVAYVRQPILNALVPLDELHLYLASTKWAEDPDAAWLNSMWRKLNAEVWYASQNEMKIHKRLRDETSYFWLAGELIGPATWVVGNGWHVCRQYMSSGAMVRARENAGTDKAPRATDRRRYRFTRKAKQFYNSFELLREDPKQAGRRQQGPVQPAPVRPVLELVDEEAAS